MKEWVRHLTPGDWLICQHDLEPLNGVPMFKNDHVYGVLEINTYEILLEDESGRGHPMEPELVERHFNMLWPTTVE